MAEFDSQYVRIQRAIWNKTAFKALSDDGKLLFFYLDTCPHGNMLGYFVMPPGYACEDLGWDRKRLAKGFGELYQNGLILVDDETRVVLDLHHIEKFPPENPNQVKAAISKLNELPNNSLYQAFSDMLDRIGKPFIKPLQERLVERLGEHVKVEVKVEVKEEVNYLAHQTPSQSNGKFTKFWEAYPKKKSKGDAEKAFKACKVDDALLAVILSSVEKLKGSEDWKKEGGQFIPYPATWLRAKGWEDEVGADQGGEGSVRAALERRGLR